MWKPDLFDIALISTNQYWGEMRFAYNAAKDVEYSGVAKTRGASTSSGNHWYVKKYTYNADLNVTRIEGPIEGNWDDRAAMAWT
jgi:hypothetical protein